MRLELGVVSDKQFTVGLVEDLVGTAAAGAELELMPGVALQYRTRTVHRDLSTAAQVLLFAINVPLSVASAVAADLIVGHFRRCDRDRITSISVSDSHGGRQEIDLYTSDAHKQVTLTIETLRISAITDDQARP